jgi:hypothetical protein
MLVAQVVPEKNLDSRFPAFATRFFGFQVFIGAFKVDNTYPREGFNLITSLPFICPCFSTVSI